MVLPPFSVFVAIFYHGRSGEICGNPAAGCIFFRRCALTVNFAYYDSPLGLIQIGYEGEVVVSIRRHQGKFQHIPSPVSELANSQLQEYFCGKRISFDLALHPKGTPFQQAVWQALLDIPYGEVRTYGQIAAAIGKPKAARAVGQAANRNPLWIVVPCHRVVGSCGKLTGYAGGLDLKQYLLKLEQTDT